MRAGLVGTNTIRQNESREASLDYLVENGGIITEAVSTQVWSGDAAVHVSIVNWLKAAGSTQETGRARFQRAASGIPAGRIDATREAPSASAAGPGAGDGSGKDAETGTLEACAPISKREGGAPRYRLTFQRGDSVDSPWESHELPGIHPALAIGTDVTGAQVLVVNEKAKKCFFLSRCIRDHCRSMARICTGPAHPV